MKLVLGCDHGGFELKNKVLEYLTKKGYECEDVGTYTTDSVDYPDIAKKVCEKGDIILWYRHRYIYSCQ